MNVKQLQDISALVDTFCRQMDELMARDAARKKAARQVWQQQSDNLETAAGRLEAEYADREARCTDAADQYARQAKEWLEELDDPLWHTVKDNCFLQCASPRAELAGMTEEQLLAFLEERQAGLETVLAKLKSGFIPPSMSGAVGRVIPTYKRKLHRRLAQHYTDICCAAETLRRCGNMTRSRAQTAARKARTQQSYDDRLTHAQALAEGETRQKALRLQKTIADSLQELDSRGLFRPDAPLRAGIWSHRHPYPGTPLPPSLRESADGRQLLFPLYLPLPRQSCLLLTDGSTPLAPVFTSWALDVLQAVPGSQVCFADLEGLGSRYSALSPLTEHGRVHVWSSEPELHGGLSDLSRRIAEHHTTGKVPAAPVFLFVETLERNISQQELPRFFSIAKNGPAAGVFVLFSLARDVTPERVLTDQLQHLERVSVLRLSGHTLPLGSGATLHLCPRPNLPALVQQLLACEVSRRSSRAILPLGRHLPANHAWQKKSAAKGIELLLGETPEGKPVHLIINEKNPYVITVGDMDAGKSSLYHTICLQIMANYSPDEVRLAIGDFKLGSEFNTYAEAELPSVETVVDDEDPDVMASFLRCYIAEIRRRQKLFAQLERQTGRKVRKYETFRAVRESLGGPAQPLPRLVILVDEFQTLFDNGTVTASLLTTLVRMGRTYGIHIVMASQRAIGTDSHNGFTPALQSYFTSRFVLRCPQSVARTVLNERCGDTGRENSGIMAAPALANGHAVFNNRSGELESGNCRLQCYYPDDRTISTVCQILSKLNGRGSPVLLKHGAASPFPVLPGADALLLGTSACLHQDAGVMGADVILDDTHVHIPLEQHGQNLLLTGSDVSMVHSVTRSAALYLLTRGGRQVHVFGLPASPVVRELMAQQDPVYVFHTTEEDMKAELSRQAEEGPMLRVNLFAEPDVIPAYAQGYSRTPPEAELLKQVLSHAETGQTVNLLYGRTFRNVRSQLPYVLQAAPLRLTAIGDAENLRAAMPEGWRHTPSEFDQPRADAIRAYYCSAHSGKWGKILLFSL